MNVNRTSQQTIKRQTGNQKATTWTQQRRTINVTVCKRANVRKPRKRERNQQTEEATATGQRKLVNRVNVVTNVERNVGNNKCGRTCNKPEQPCKTKLRETNATVERKRNAKRNGNERVNA